MFSSNTTQVPAVSVAEAVDFDGTNDYLTRASDFDGNADGKTFTFSAWVYISAYTGAFAPILQSQGNRVDIYIDGSGRINLLMMNSAGTTVLNAFSQAPNNVPFVINTFNNILVSVDLTSTANRHMYVNDVSIPFGYTTYTNANIDFTNTNYRVAYGASGPTLTKGRLSNVFLDYTYRDMSVTANRRLFITADLKPAAGQAALSPILYLPMSDPTTVGTNAGTGGNFTLTGTVARSGRGPNQYNAPYSDLDGSADYMDRSSAITGLADGKQFTFQCVFNNDVASNNSIIVIANGTTMRFSIAASGSGTYIAIDGVDASGNSVLTANIQPPGGVNLVVGRNYVLTVSIDLASTSTRHVYVNGQAASVTWTQYVNTAIDFLTNTPICRIGRNASTSGYWNGRLGALWFNTSYIDLSVATNLAKFVSGTGINAAPVDLGATGELPTGTAPLIYLPMYGNNAGKNYGTGGDFTVNSGPYTGARGPNEFWGNKAKFVNSYVGRSSSFNWGSTNKFTCSFWINNITNASGQQNIFYLGDSGSAYFSARLDASNRVEFWAADSGGTMILSVRSNTAIATGSSAYVQACFDLSDAAKRFIYINGANSLTSTTYTNTSTPSFNFARIGDNAFANYQLSEVYLLPDYIDFSVEANRLKFYDAFGNPTDLPSAITALSVTNPPIYMRFPPTAFGTNSGTGGAFTPTGTITDGGQL